MFTVFSTFKNKKLFGLPRLGGLATRGLNQKFITAVRGFSSIYKSTWNGIQNQTSCSFDLRCYYNIRDLNINVRSDLGISALCNFGFDPVALLLLSFPKKYIVNALQLMLLNIQNFLDPTHKSNYLNFVSVNGFKTSNRIECGLIITASRILW